MRHKVDLFIRRQAELMQAGDIDALVELFETPIPIFYSDEVALKASKEQVRHANEQIAMGIQRIGAKTVTHRLIDVSERPGTGTISCLIEFHYRNEDAEILRWSHIRYYLEPFGETSRAGCVQLVSYPAALKKL